MVGFSWATIWNFTSFLENLGGTEKGGVRPPSELCFWLFSSDAPVRYWMTLRKRCVCYQMKIWVSSLASRSWAFCFVSSSNLDLFGNKSKIQIVLVKIKTPPPEDPITLCHRISQLTRMSWILAPETLRDHSRELSQEICPFYKKPSSEPWLRSRDYWWTWKGAVCFWFPTWCSARFLRHRDSQKVTSAPWVPASVSFGTNTDFLLCRAYLRITYCTVVLQARPPHGHQGSSWELVKDVRSRARRRPEFSKLSRWSPRTLTFEDCLW